MLIGLLASVWLLHSGNELLTFLIEGEATSYKVIGEFLSDKDKQTSVGHLLAVLERFGSASQSTSEMIASVQSLISNVKGLVIGLVVLQLTSIVVFLLQHNQRG